MRIACTSCDAVYELPPERVKPGRGVKCARCATVWVPVELVDVEPEIRPEAEPVTVLNPAPEPVPDPVAEPPLVARPDPIETPPRRAPIVLAWVLTILVVAGAGWSALAYRGAITQAWPPAERAYRILHLG